MKSDEELRLEQIVSRGMQAEQVLNNPVFKEAILSIRGELMRAFEQSKFKDADDREEIWRKTQIVNWFESRIEKEMRNGEVAKKTLAQRAKETVKHVMFKR